MTIFTKFKQLLFTNCWLLRFLVGLLGLISLFMAFYMALRNIVQRATSNNPIEVCLIWLWMSNRNPTVKLLYGSIDFIIYIVLFFFCFISLAAINLILLSSKDRILTLEFFYKTPSPRVQTAFLTLSIVFSIFPSAFKSHHHESFYVGFLMIFWAFSVQFFLQSKTDFGLFSCTTSAIFTIFTSLVECKPTGINFLLLVAAFIIVVVLNLYHTTLTYNPTKDEVHFRGPREIYTVTMVLKNITPAEYRKRRREGASDNEFFHVKQDSLTADGRSLFHLIPCSAIDQEARTPLRIIDPSNYQYLTEYYTLEAQETRGGGGGGGARGSRRRNYSDPRM